MCIIRFGGNWPFPKSPNNLSIVGFPWQSSIKCLSRDHPALPVSADETPAASISTTRQITEFSLAGFWLVKGFFSVCLFPCVFFFIFFPCSFCLSEKGQRFLCGQRMKARKGFLLYEASSRAARWLRYPSSKSLLEPQTERLFCLERASLAPSSATTFMLPNPGRHFPLTPRWHRPRREGCAQGMVTPGSHGGV